MRGKGYEHSCDTESTGITPAYAGKRRIRKRRAFEVWDHPRLCGEKDSRIVAVDVRVGSPPPMRGKANGNYTRKGDARITPAYAGKSRKCVHAVFYCRDHPRLCGEKLATFAHSSKVTGSPPPMRGKVELCIRGFDRFGITPAYAGKRVTG